MAKRLHDTYDNARGVDRPSSWGETTRRDYADTGFMETTVIQTVAGFVIATSSLRNDGRADTSLFFIWNGKRHARYIRKYYRPRRLVTLAWEFAAHVIRKEQTR